GERAALAQLVEQRIRNAWVAGSSPACGTTTSNHTIRMTHQALSGQEAGHAGSSTGVAIVHGGRRVRLKWQRHRRRRRDPLFDAETLAEGLRLGASMEVDLRVTRDGDFAVLHDGTLDRETDGTGAVVECTGEEIRALHYRSAGAPRPVLLASDLAQALGP